MLAPAHILLTLACLLVPAQGQEKQEKSAPSAEQVARAAAELDFALGSGDLQGIKAALEAAQSVPHADVVRRVVRALEDERLEVRLAAIQSLRWLDHPEALEALHRALKDRKLRKVPQVMPALLQAIGQHADPRSIEILSRDPFEPRDAECLRARIYGLGRIRTREALDALFGILSLTATDRQGERLVRPWMDEMRLSLMILTGVDQGKTPELWERWWRESRKDFLVPESIPELPKDLREIWDGFWGLPRDHARARRREDRGGSDEPGRGEFWLPAEPPLEPSGRPSERRNGRG